MMKNNFAEKWHLRILYSGSPLYSPTILDAWTRKLKSPPLASPKGKISVYPDSPRHPVPTLINYSLPLQKQTLEKHPKNFRRFAAKNTNNTELVTLNILWGISVYHQSYWIAFSVYLGEKFSVYLCTMRFRFTQNKFQLTRREKVSTLKSLDALRAG